MKGLELVKKTREYTDYIEEHLNNVWKAFKEIEKKCQHMTVMTDDSRYWALRQSVEDHDISKFSTEEFVQYRDSFFPLDGEEKKPLGDAWEHHKKSNDHHWQNWTQYKGNHPHYQEICCTHMVIDWLAMSYKFNDTPRNYYEKNKDEIELPEWAVRYIYEIFDALKK